MPNFISCDNQYSIGAIAKNFPVTTMPGFAFYEVPSLATYDGRTRMDDYRDGGIISNCQLSTIVKGIILNESFTPFSRMNIGDFTINAGVWYEAYPPSIIPAVNIGSLNSSALFCYDQTLNGDGLSPAEVTYNGQLVACPTIGLQIVRNIMPPYGMTPQQRLWQFSFGNGYMLSFGCGPDLYLYYNGVVIGHHYISTDAAQTDFATATYLTFIIRNLMGNLVVEGNKLDATWTVQQVGMIPAGPYSMYSAGGQFAFNVTQANYPTAGYVVTDQIQHWQIYADSWLDNNLSGTFPPNVAAAAGMPGAIEHL